MALTAADIQNVSFSIDRKGYDVDEVDVFLEHVADEIAAMNKQIEELEAELENAKAAAVPAPAPAAAEAKASADEEQPSADVAELQNRITDLEAQLAEKVANDSAISQALIVAQRSADEIVSNARAEASGIIKDADEEADRIIGKAESDRLRIAEAIRALEADRDDVRAGYREMLSNFMGDAQRKLAEIDGDSRRANVASQARSDANAAAYAPMGGMVVTPTPAVDLNPISSQVQVATPAASGYIDKDFSGYGAPEDDFEFDDID